MHRPIHFEMQVPDPQVVLPFYERAFGWKFTKWDGPFEYWLAFTGDEANPGINGGLMRAPDGQPRTVNTLKTANVDDACAKVVANGGVVVVPKMAIAGVGYVAYCTDPGGGLFGVMHYDPNAA